MVTLKQKNWAYFLIGGLLALVIIVGIGSVLAQTDDEDPAPTPEAEQTTPDVDETEAVPGFGFGRRGFGRFGGGDSDSKAHSEALAEALGITVDELDAAKQEAREAVIAQAVADGDLTQEQADELLANGFGGRGWHFDGEMETYLAEALGISVEALEEARNEVFAAQLAAMVEGGMITQEQADFALAQRAVQDYVDTDALEATVRSAYEDAVAQALADGVITQEQADQLLAQLSERSFNFRGFRGFGFGRHGHGGPGGGRGFGGPRGFFGNGMAPNTEVTPSGTGTSNDL